MKNKNVFTFEFDTTKTEKIRKALDERSVFTDQTRADVIVKKQGNGNNIKATFSAHDMIYVALCRIEDTLRYMNTLELGKNKENTRGAFDFFDFLNNMYVVIHCIRALANAFNLNDDIKNIEKSTECFFEKGLDGNGTDHDFFEYVRSLVSVHPTATSKHPSYNGYEKMHCSPFVVWTTDGLGMRGDLSALIYTSEQSGDIESLQLYIANFEKYLTKWIDFMDTIVEGIKSFQYECTEELIEKAILEVTAFDSYTQYISNLKKEYKNRIGGYGDYVLEYYMELFSLELTNAKNADKFTLYKNAIKYSLSFLHKRLQTMSNDDNSYTGIVYPEPNIQTELFLELWLSTQHNGQISNCNYEIEKLNYLDDSGSFDERYSRKLLEKIKPLINEYVVFTNKEPAFETKVLLSIALYFEGLDQLGILNRNIPNSLKYRERLLTEGQQNALLEDWQNKLKPKSENKFRKFAPKTH